MEFLRGLDNSAWVFNQTKVWVVTLVVNGVTGVIVTAKLEQDLETKG